MYQPLILSGAGLFCCGGLEERAHSKKQSRKLENGAPLIRIKGLPNLRGLT